MKKVKNYILGKLGISNIREQLGNHQKKSEDLQNQIKVLRREKEELMRRVGDLEKLAVMQWGGLNEEKRTPRIIVSMTSFPARIRHVSKVLGNMLLQTVKPDKIVLWLSKEQFPNGESDLPEQLIKLKAKGVEIEWCDGDIKAYKKFLPALKKFPDDILVIVDDDLVYSPELVEKLYEAHQKFPDAIIASRCHEIKRDENGKISSYKTWKKQCNYDTYQYKDNWFFTGGAGTLLPPHIFGDEIFDMETIGACCPWADDVWLNINAAMNRVPIINTAAYHRLTRIEATQEERLQDINLEQNDVQLKSVATKFRQKLIGTIYENL